MSELFNRLMSFDNGNTPSTLRALLMEAAKELAHQEAAQLVLRGEIEKLHTRLEDNFAYKTVEGKEGLQRFAVPPGSIPDGIECRETTIKLLEGRIRELEKKLALPI